MAKHDDEEVGQPEFLGVVLRISPEHPEQGRDATPSTRTNRLDEYDLPPSHGRPIDYDQARRRHPSSH